MGIARLLAKGWIIFCLFAGAHALRFAIKSGGPLQSSILAIGICALLFMAMGLLGEYIGRIYHDVRGRPLFFLDRVAGESQLAPPQASSAPGADEVSL